MIGRGAQGNPWIFKRINHYMQTGEILPEPTLEEKIDTAMKHLKLGCSRTWRICSCKRNEKTYCMVFKRS